MTTEAQWLDVWGTVCELVGNYPDDLVVIGGVAVYLYSRSRPSLAPEYTHDADFYVGDPGWISLQDDFLVTKNARLSKASMKLHGVKIDLYPQYEHGLRIDYEELAEAANEVDNVAVADLRHLLVLKLDAFRDRGRSETGKKDRRDITRLLVLLEDESPELIAGVVTDEDVELLEDVLRSSAMMEISAKNAKKASALRRRATKFVERLKEER
jgi:hypothetical protein